MTDLEKFMSTLNEEETKGVNNVIRNNGGTGPEKEFIEMMIRTITNDYLRQEEYDVGGKNSERILRRLDEVRSKWHKLGFLEDYRPNPYLL